MGSLAAFVDIVEMVQSTFPSVPYVISAAQSCLLFLICNFMVGKLLDIQCKGDEDVACSDPDKHTLTGE